MKRISLLLGGAALALTSAFAIAQDAPESLLPPGFDKPRPSRAPVTPAPAPAPAPVTKSSGNSASGAGSVSVPVVQAVAV